MDKHACTCTCTRTHMHMNISPFSQDHISSHSSQAWTKEEGGREREGEGHTLTQTQTILQPSWWTLESPWQQRPCRSSGAEQTDRQTGRSAIRFLCSFPLGWNTFLRTFFGLPEIKPWVIVHGFWPKSENFDLAKKECHRKELFKRSRLALISAP